MSKILVLNGNPKPESLSHSFSEAYSQGVLDSGNMAKVIHISELNFDLNLENGYAKKQELGKDLKNLQKEIQDADRVVIITPVWWGTVPAKLKGVFDRILLPGFAFEYQRGKANPRKLLQGKKGSIIVTMDTPVWYYRLFQGDPIIKTIKRTILEFCGVKVDHISRFGPILSSTQEQREKWIRQVNMAGQRDALKSAL
ncbi:MAG: NAD(P)H-dependent oxidoreductase [Chloroflexi bacterium]|nr:NAD(P)H-dependent oxidoreductase [Chloroflexota bacterium]